MKSSRRGAGLWALTSVVGLAALGGACIDAVQGNGTIEGVQGGTTLPEASTLAPQNPPGEAPPCTDTGKAGSVCTAAGTCCGIAAGTEICAFNGTASGVCTTEPPLGTGITWTELYADYFGGTGRAACAGNGNCHASMSEPGFAASQYVCPPDDKDACYTGITSMVAGLITKGEMFEGDYLHQVLRKENAGDAGGLGNMPLAPTQIYAFTGADLDRIGAWIAAGFPND